ncbi:MAG: hydrogenase formation protein HypD [Firmicutes bacterium]|nr:hydrogenase formation protein HypD [Bacillota bacterium]
MEFAQEKREDKSQKISLLTDKLANICALPALTERKMRFMEVCGTHTMSVYRHGLKNLLPHNVELISGPGCPVCVTPANLLSQALAIARLPGVIMTSFGDMLRVPVAEDSLLKARAEGCDIRLITSPLEALEIAASQPDKQVVFLAVGFETTAPLSAATIKKAALRGINNFSVFSAHRLMPQALRQLLASNPRIDGLLLPGHVAAITGSAYFAFIPQELGLPATVAGFEAEEIMAALLALTQQLANQTCCLENSYTRAVGKEANSFAINIMEEVFMATDAYWRGLGEIKLSGLALKPAYLAYDALSRFNISVTKIAENPLCRCGDVLRGELDPPKCPLFSTVCHPENPQGACMVSAEGACAAAFKYQRP